jgi:Holliday junction resolvase
LNATDIEETEKMSFDTYVKLEKILKKYEPKKFGSICQYLLEFTLKEIGFQTRGRAVERPDIVAQRLDEKYAIESKYQIGTNLSLTQRDLDGIMDFLSSGYTPIVAFLFMDISSKWLMVNASKIRPGKSNKTALKIYEIHTISNEVNDQFPKIVEDNFDIIWNRGAEGIRSKINNT